MACRTLLVSLQPYAMPEVALTILHLLSYTCIAELRAEPQMHGYYRGLFYNTVLVPFQFYR